MKYPIVVILLWGIFTGCLSREKLEVKQFEVTVENVISCDGGLLSPKDIRLLRDSLVVITESGSEAYYKLFVFNETVDSLDFVSSFGHKGRGPGELLSISRMQLIGNDTLGVYDFNRKYFNYFFPVEDLLLEDDLSVSHSYIDLSDSDPFLNIIQITDSIWVGSSAAFDFRFGLKIKDEPIESLAIPFPNDRVECSPVQKSMVYQGILAKHPTNQWMIVYVSGVGDILEIYDLTKPDRPLVTSIPASFPKYEVDPNVSSTYATSGYVAGTTNGYNQVYVTNEYIFALYNGRSYKDRDRQYYGDTIRVFDWNGHHLANIVLDKDAITFTIDENRNYIYTLHTTLDYEEQMLRFYLPESFH